MSHSSLVERPQTNLSPEGLSIKSPRSTELDVNTWSLGVDIQNLILNDRSLMASDFGLRVKEWLKLPDDYNHEAPALGDTMHKIGYAADNGLELPSTHGDTTQDSDRTLNYKLVVGQLQELFHEKDVNEPRWWERDEYSMSTQSDEFNTLPLDKKREIFGAIIRRQHEHIATIFPGCNPEQVFAEMIHTDYVNHASNDLIYAFRDGNPRIENVLSTIYLLTRLEQTGPELPGVDKPGDYYMLKPIHMHDTVELIDSLKWRLEIDKERTASLGNKAVQYGTELADNYSLTA